MAGASLFPSMMINTKFLQLNPAASMTYVETSKTSRFFFKSNGDIYQVKHKLLKRTLSELCPLMARQEERMEPSGKTQEKSYRSGLIDYLLKTGALKWGDRQAPFVSNKRCPIEGTRITYLGHTSILVESGKDALLIDPMLYALTPRHWRLAQTRQGVIEPEDLPVSLSEIPVIDAIAISHIHADHFDPFTLFWFDKTVPICIPRVRTALKNPIRQMGFSQIHALNNWKTRSVGTIRLTRVPSHRQLDSIGYTEQCTWLVETPHVNAYFGTDIRFMPKVFAEVARKTRLDVAFLPASSHHHLGRDVTMGEEQALEAVGILNPGFTVPYACWDHWWLPRNTENFRGTRRGFLKKAVTHGIKAHSGPAGTAYLFRQHRLIQKRVPSKPAEVAGLRSSVNSSTLE